MIDLTQFEKPIPIECGECMLSHCETCPDHVHALNQLKQFPTLLAKCKELKEEVIRLRDLKVTEYVDLVTAHNALKAQDDLLALEVIKLRQEVERFQSQKER